MTGRRKPLRRLDKALTALRKHLPELVRWFMIQHESRILLLHARAPPDTAEERRHPGGRVPPLGQVHIDFMVASIQAQTRREGRRHVGPPRVWLVRPRRGQHLAAAGTYATAQLRNGRSVGGGVLQALEMDKRHTRPRKYKCACTLAGRGPQWTEHGSQRRRREHTTSAMMLERVAVVSPQQQLLLQQQHCPHHQQQQQHKQQQQQQQQNEAEEGDNDHNNGGDDSRLPPPPPVVRLNLALEVNVGSVLDISKTACPPPCTKR